MRITLLVLVCLVSVIAFGQKTDGELNTQNNNTIFTATLTPTRVGNMFEQSILSKVNKRTPEFLDSADITKRIKFYFNGSHPTATTYNVTWPNKSGTVAFLDDISGVDTTAFWKTTGISYMKNDTVRIATNEVDFVNYIDAIEFELNRGTPFGSDGKIQINYFDGSVRTPKATFDASNSVLGNLSSGVYMGISGSNASAVNGSSSYSVLPNRILLNPADSIVASKQIRYSGVDVSSAATNALVDKNYVINQPKTFNNIQVFNNVIDAATAPDIRIVNRASDPSSTESGNIWNRDNRLRFSNGSTAKVIAFLDEVGVSDGDKGDITVSGSGATWTIDNTAVTYAKIQNVAANSFLANATGSGATVQEIATNRIPLFSSAITGTPSSSTYLRGDGSWQTISSGIGGSTGSTDKAILVANGTGESTLQASGLTIDGDRIGSSTNIELDAADSVLVIGDDANEVILGKNTAGQRLGYLEINVENSIVMRSESPVNITSYGQSFTSLESSIGISPDSAAYVSNTTFPTVQQANASYFGAKDVDGSSDLFSLSEAGVEINLSGKLTPKVETGTSFTIDATHIAQGTYTSNGSAVTVTVPSNLQTGSVIIIMQEGAGTVTLSAGTDVVLSGKTATTGATDFIWLWLYKKDGGDSYYVGR